MSEISWSELFATLPPLSPFTPEQFSIQPLPGLTNRNYRLHGEGVDYVLRLPGTGSALYLDRRAEIHNIQQAIQLGLVPEWIYADSSSGVLLSRYLPGRSLQSADLCQDDTLEKALSLLRRLHRSSAEFQGRWPLFATLDQYLQYSQWNSHSPPWCSELAELRSIAERWRSEIEQQAQPLCASHCDPNPANFRLQPTGRLWLLDWEYSAQAEPAWDLAALVVEADLDAAHVVRLYAAKADLVLLRRVCLHMAFLHLLAAAWSAAQIGLGNQSVTCLEETIGLRIHAATRCLKLL